MLGKISFLLLFFSICTNLALYGQKNDSLIKRTCYILNEIEISGNHKTKNSIISRELPLAVCDTLPKSNLEDFFERYRQNIFNTNLFIWVKISYNINENGGIKVKIEVKEPWYFLAAPIVYLADRNINEWWYDRNRDLKRITYGIYAKHQNLTGNNDQLRLRIFGGFIPYLELNYRKPYIDKKQRMGFQAGIYYSEQRSMPYRTWKDKLDFVDTEDKMKKRYGTFIELSLRNKLYHYHKVDMQLENLTLNDTILKLNPNFLANGKVDLKYLRINYEYIFDKRDNKQYALTGDLFRANTNYILSNYKQSSLGIAYSKYLPIYKKLYFDATLKFKFSFIKDQPYFFTNGIGYGSTIIRGYELYVIDGQKLGIFKTNLKYQLIKRTFDLQRFIKIKQFNSLPIQIFANAYLDGGYIQNYNPQWSITKLGNKKIIGKGIGLDVVTWYNSIFKLNYSFNQFNEKRFYIGLSKGIF